MPANLENISIRTHHTAELNHRAFIIIMMAILMTALIAHPPFTGKGIPLMACAAICILNCLNYGYHRRELKKATPANHPV